MKNAALLLSFLSSEFFLRLKPTQPKNFQETLTVFQTSSSTAIQKDQTLVSGEAKFTEYEELLYTATAEEAGNFSRYLEP